MSTDRDSNQLLGDCAEALSQPDCAILVGAGASVDAHLPTWNQLLESFAAKVPPAIAPAIRHLKDTNAYLEAAELARMTLTDDVWQSVLEPFDTRGVTTSTWSLIASLGAPKLVTTNWDNIAADSFARVFSKTARSYVGRETALVAQNEAYPHVIYIHGRAPAWKSLVFTNTTYREAEASDQYRAFWIDLMMRRPLLVVGFSGDDPAFQRVLSYIRDVLNVGNHIRPFVVYPKSKAAENFGPHARMLYYDDSGGHDEVKALLKDLRERVDAIRARKGLEADPFQRAGMPPLYVADRSSLLVALAGIDLRMHCGPESFVAITLLVGAMAKTGVARANEVVDRVIEQMRVSQSEAREVVENAIAVASSFGWVNPSGDEVRATALAPTVSEADFDPLILHVLREAQGRVVWSRSARRDQYIKDAILGYLGTAANQSAGDLLGASSNDAMSGRQLRRALTAKNLSIGDQPVEESICEAIVNLLDDPPASLKQVCGRLDNFAFVTALVSHPLGRELLRAKELDRLYLDTNVVLPAIAPGHEWHHRCRALIDNARRFVRSIVLLTGFLEELQIQFDKAVRLSEEESDVEDFYNRALLHDERNGFLDAYVNWCDESGLIPFDSYCSKVGLATAIDKRVQGLGVLIARPKVFERDEVDVHARAEAGLRRSHGALSIHEADQIAQLFADNRNKRLYPSRFVTSHSMLRNWAVEKYPKDIGPAVMHPGAFLQYLTALAPKEIEPSSLRELAFNQPGIDVAQALFGVLLKRFGDDREKLSKMLTDEVAEKIIEQVDSVSKQLHSAGHDARLRVFQMVAPDAAVVVEKTMEKVSATAPHVLSPKSDTESPRRAARRLARQLFKKYGRLGKAEE